MHHLRWVNEALDLLGQTPSLGRAKLIGRTFRRRFSLRPLTPKQLQGFIDVEKPNQEIGGRIDGMYVVLHTSIGRQSELFPERDRLVHLIKLIIDEGGDHYERFISVQKHLAEMRPDDYLRTLPLVPAHFFTQQDFGNERTRYINAELRNAPNVTAFHHGLEALILFRQKLVFRSVDKVHDVRQLHEIAELGKPENEPTNAPEFMQLKMTPGQPHIESDDDLDFRDEIYTHIFERRDPQPKRTLHFDIFTSNRGRTKGFSAFKRVIVENWRDQFRQLRGFLQRRSRHPFPSSKLARRPQ